MIAPALLVCADWADKDTEVRLVSTDLPHLLHLT